MVQIRSWKGVEKSRKINNPAWNVYLAIKGTGLLIPFPSDSFHQPNQ